MSLAIMPLAFVVILYSFFDCLINASHISIRNKAVSIIFTAESPRSGIVPGVSLVLNIYLLNESMDQWMKQI